MQADLDEGLRRFPDQAFDVVVLEETLQTLANPREMLAEMLRVGRRGMVSFPNFAHWRVLVDLVASGRMPVTEWLPYQWYETANIHPFTLQDLLDWSRDSGVRVSRNLDVAGRRAMVADERGGSGGFARGHDGGEDASDRAATVGRLPIQWGLGMCVHLCPSVDVLNGHGLGCLAGKCRLQDQCSLTGGTPDTRRAHTGPSP